MKAGKCLAVAVGCWLSFAAAGSASDVGRHALLIGVSHYPSLGERYQLQGPANDVPLMYDLLVERFGFASEDIRILSEEAGHEDDDALPTRANIEREFRRLAEVAGSGDSIVVFMAGHGAQQPEQSNGEYREPDGLDEIFLPRDVTQWQGEGSGGKVPNAIIDDEIGEWLAAIQAKDAHIWAIFDCCHSGDITRGFGERERFVSATDREGLGIPGEALVEARQRSIAHLDTPGTARDHRVAVPIEMDLERAAVFYASQPHEKAIERNLPDAGGKPYGLLTYSLNAVLQQSGGSLSYAELGKRVQQKYLHLGRTQGPTPLVEGGDLKRAVLGTEILGRAPILLSAAPTGRGLQVDAGRLHGLTAGSVLAVYPPPSEVESGESQDGQPVGHVRVTHADVATSTVVPCAFAQMPEPPRKSLPGGRCKVVELDHGDLLLRVAVDRQDAAGKPTSEPIIRRLQEYLAALAGRQRSLVQQVRDPQEADWFIRFHAGNVYLVPASAWSGAALPTEDAEATGDGVLGPFRLDGTLPDVLHQALYRIGRAENLLKLAASQQGGSFRHDFAVQMNVEVRRIKDAFDQAGEPISAPMQMQPGHVIQFVVSNSGAVPFDLSILYVDSRHGISVLFPAGGEMNRWYAGEAPKRLPPVVFHDETLGREHVVLLAVSAKGPNVDFTGLAQESIQTYRSLGVRTRGGESPLASLLERALYAEGATRSLAAPQIASFQFEVIPVDVRLE